MIKSRQWIHNHVLRLTPPVSPTYPVEPCSYPNQANCTKKHCPLNGNSAFLAKSQTSKHCPRLDCSPVTDGAASVVLCASDKAKDYADKPIKIIGAGQGSDTLALHGRRDICTLDATVHASKMAYKQANLKPKDIDVAEVHDCFTIAEICAIEDLGFVKKGEGGKAIDNKITTIDGSIPVNTSGGLKAKGHPVGATGVAQIIEIVLQLQGRAEKRQLKDANIGLAHNVGGSGATSTVHIMEAN